MFSESCQRKEITDKERIQILEQLVRDLQQRLILIETKLAKKDEKIIRPPEYNVGMF